MESGSRITTESKAGAGKGGDIELQAGNVRLSSGSRISAESGGTGDAGDIRIMAQDTFRIWDSSVTTEAKQSGGGNIGLYAGSLVHLVNSKVTTTVQGGDRNAGNITFQRQADSDAPTRRVILNNSQIVANAFEGKGGNIRIVAGMFMADPDSLVDASSKLGIDGTVDIRTPVTQISGSLAPLSQEFLSPAALLRERCAERIGEKRLSRLVVSGRDGLPPEPGSFLPSPLSFLEEAGIELPLREMDLPDSPASRLSPAGFDRPILLPVGGMIEGSKALLPCSRSIRGPYFSWSSGEAHRGSDYSSR